MEGMDLREVQRAWEEGAIEVVPEYPGTYMCFIQKWHELEVYKDNGGKLRVVWPDNKLVSEIHPSRWGKRVV